MRAFLFFVSVFSFAILTKPHASIGCGIPWRAMQPVRVASEDALIVWDATTKTEHFIRRALFKTDAKDFGFLVPTPTEPTLAEADDAIFTSLSQATAPRIIHQNRVQQVYRDQDSITPGAAPRSPAPSGPLVEVLKKQKVAGYDAVVLKANDPEALRKWLEKHGYEARPALTEWFKWYTDHNWLMTAFKISSDGSVAQQISGRTVRLSFKTETPFYPYREPADMREKPKTPGDRLLRVYFLGDKRFEGTLGKDGKWPGEPVWANALPDHTKNAVFNGIGLEADAKKSLTEQKWHLTEFEDKSFPRPGTDEVYFHVAEKQDHLERPPIVVYHDVYEYIDSPAVPFVDRFGRLALGGVVALALVAICFLLGVLLRKR